MNESLLSLSFMNENFIFKLSFMIVLSKLSISIVNPSPYVINNILSNLIFSL